jgi:uncharacterized surface protein with fasciclin (FAS1) repeats
MFHRSLPRLFFLSAIVLGLVTAFREDLEEIFEPRDRDPDGTDDEGTDADTVVDLATDHPDFGTLCLALKTAGLVETLQEPGPYTVLAPTDEAFRTLNEKLDELLADPESLRTVLTNHIVQGSLTASDLASKEGIEALSGMGLTIDASDGTKLNGCRVVEADLRAGNGIIHAIDGIIGLSGPDAAEAVDEPAEQPGEESPEETE